MSVDFSLDEFCVYAAQKIGGVSHQYIVVEGNTKPFEAYHTDKHYRTSIEDEGELIKEGSLIECLKAVEGHIELLDYEVKFL